MHWHGLLFAYIGPETIIPATSALAVVGGLLLTFGKSITWPVVRLVRVICGKKAVAGVDVPAEEQVASSSNQQ